MPSSRLSGFVWFWSPVLLKGVYTCLRLHVRFWKIPRKQSPNVKVFSQRRYFAQIAIVSIAIPIQSSDQVTWFDYVPLEKIFVQNGENFVFFFVLLFWGLFHYVSIYDFWAPRRTEQFCFVTLDGWNNRWNWTFYLYGSLAQLFVCLGPSEKNVLLPNYWNACNRQVPLLFIPFLWGGGRGGGGRNPNMCPTNAREI